MTLFKKLSLAAAIFTGASVSAQQPGLDAPVSIAPYFNATFPASAPGSATGWLSENAFPNLTFVDPIWLTEIPNTSNFLLVGKNGQLWRFANNPAVAQAQVVKVLEWTANTQSSEDQGFYSLVFHPEFGLSGSPNANYAYVCYNHKPALAGADANHSYWRVSRFTWQPATGTLDPASEFVLINQYDRCRWHNGGAMYFDNDGFLNITCGDGGDSAEGGGLYGVDGALSRTQRLNHGFFSGIFRIDVNNNSSTSHAIRRQPGNPTNRPAGWPASSTQGYMIPNDNPWLDPAGSLLEEYHSHGLRSPHTAHYDSITGEVWVGDVGEGQREEITRLRKGDNAQWGFMEGSIGGPGATPTPIIGASTLPFYDYNRATGTCIIGGMRYRGTKWNNLLGGKLLFGDHVRGRIWTATVDGTTPIVEEIIAGLPTGNKVGLGNFCTDSAGEIYLLTVNGTNVGGGTIRKLNVAGVSAEPPQFLSQTGLFRDLTNLVPHPSLIPYDVPNALWSDAAAKKRWIILPNDGSHNTAAEDIVFNETAPWVFPAGTILVKHFDVNTNAADPLAIKRLETRLIVCTDNGGKYGITYRWNAGGTDATLLTSGDTEIFQVTNHVGQTETRQWDYPSRADCMLCHTDAAGQALGVRTPNLNSTAYYPATGRYANQLATFNALGMFDRMLTTAELEDYLESRPLTDTSAPLEHRVRSYLDTNCAHCHRPGGTIDHFDARMDTPLINQNLINQSLKGHFNFDPAGKYIKPGSTALSAIHHRINNVGNGAAMPPLAKNLKHDEALAQLQNYVLSLTDAEFQTTSSPTARYVRLTALSEVNGNPWTSVAEFSILDQSGNPIPFSETSIHDFDSEETVDEVAPVSRIIDGNINTFWHTEWGAIEPAPPHHVTIDLGSLRQIGGYIYTPRQGAQNGRIASYQIHYSNDATNWTLINSGTWSNAETVQRYDGLVGRRKARCSIGAPVNQVNGAFDLTIAYDTNVTDFTASDIAITGGTVTNLRGKGYYYIARISPTSSNVSLSIPADVANATGLGNFASQTHVVPFLDLLPPTPQFTNVPATVNGPYTIGLTFGEVVTGLTMQDFTITNGTLLSLTPNGINYTLEIQPTSPGNVITEIRSRAVTDNSGLLMATGLNTISHFTGQNLNLAASQASINQNGGMILVNDINAPNGQYLWLPDAAFPNNFNLPVKTQHSATFTFHLPHAGQWMVKGLIQSTDNSSDSFWTEIDGNAATGTVYLWDTAPINTIYEWDYMNARGGANPVVLNLSAGIHTVTIYGRDDGTRLAQLEMESIRPLANLSSTNAIINGPFTVNLTFSESITGLTTSDLAVSGASITEVVGSGSTYQISVLPTQRDITIALNQNTVLDTTGSGNFVSNILQFIYRNPYNEWAFSHAMAETTPDMSQDHDNDGISNLLEYAFNLDPNAANSHNLSPATNSGLPSIAVIEDPQNGPTLQMQYLRRPNSGLTYHVQFGSTINDFVNTSNDPVIETLADGWERCTMTDPAGPGHNRRFGRVLISHP